MTRLADMLPPAETHLVRTILNGTRNWCEAHGESPEDAELHAALDATTWVKDLVKGEPDGLVLIETVAIVAKEDPRTTEYRQMRLAG